MPTLIAFSAKQGDFIVVETDLNETNNKLSNANKTASGMCELTQIPAERQVFEPMKIFVNPDRVAYIKPPAGG